MNIGPWKETLKVMVNVKEQILGKGTSETKLLQQRKPQELRRKKELKEKQKIKRE
jgi:hypothetical protein